jgi:hypothetical protein
MAPRAIALCAGPCRRRLAAAEFLPNLKLQGGLGSYCRDCLREKKRQWREAHPEEIAAYNESRRKPLAELVECEKGFEGRPHAMLCSRRCKDRRYRRMHPEQVRAKERRKYERRRERRSVPSKSVS